MTRHKDWPSFQLAVVELQRRSPDRMRYCVRYKHRDGLLVLRATDDVELFARSAALLNRFEILTRHVLHSFSNTKPESDSTPQPPIKTGKRTKRK